MSPQIAIEAPDAKEIQEEHRSLVEAARSIRVGNADQHQEALEIFRMLKVREKAVEDRLRPIIDAAHKAHRGLTTLLSDLQRPIQEAVLSVQRECLTFEEAQKRKAEEEARRLAELARKQEEERALQDAIDAEAAGDKLAAAEILAAPVEIPVVTVAPQVAEVKGVSSRVTWGAEVVDLLALVKYVASHPEWVGLLQANGPAINKLAQAQREALKLPGVRAVAKKSMSARVGA